MPDLDDLVASQPLPFAPNQPRRYYATPELTQRLHLIRHLLQNSEQLLVVIAPAGSGKTTLLNQIKLHAADHWWFYTPTVSSATSPENLASLILSAFNVRQEGKSLDDMVTMLRNHTASTRYNGQLPILLVDDAHLLPLATLKHLVEWAITGESQTRMRVLLFCEPQITSIFATPELAILHNTLIHTLDVPALTELQMRDYIQFYLQGSTYSQHHPFNTEALRRLYQQTHGIPEETNLYAYELLRHFSEQNHVTSLTGETQPYQKLLWGAVIIVVLLGVAWLLSWKMPEILTSFSSADAPRLLDANGNMVQPLRLPAPSETPLVVDNTPQPITDTDDLAAHTVTSDVDTTVEPDAEDTEATTDGSGDSNTATSAAATDASNTTIANDTPSTSDAALPMGVEESVNDNALLLNSQAQEQAVLKDLIALYPNLHGEKWLLEQDANAYTLQILGTHELASMTTFLRHYTLDGTLAVYKTDYRNKPWYVLAYGIFPQQRQAVDGLKTLPDALKQDTQPFPRRLSNVHSHIRKRVENL